MDKHLIAGMVIAGLFQTTGHYLPTSTPWKRPTVPGRIVAYTWGVTGIVLGLFVATDRHVARRALAVSLAAGAATIGAYALDEALRHGRNN